MSSHSGGKGLFVAIGHPEFTDGAGGTGGTGGIGAPVFLVGGFTGLYFGVHSSALRVVPVGLRVFLFLESLANLTSVIPINQCKLTNWNYLTSN